MRIKEWYSWHFPELGKIINDNYSFVRLAALIGNRDSLSEELLEQLDEITGDGEVSRKILEASRSSMGQDLSETDAESLLNFTNKVVEQYKFREELQTYLTDRMNNVAPNLTSLIGENVGAKLISKAGSLTNLAKYPASTIQILGAEKALFRALKTKGNTPKYGLLYNSSFISRANQKDKGRISRFLANKCAIASRLDMFLNKPTTAFGAKMKDQVEERLNFLATGEPTKKNVDIMKEVLDELKEENLYVSSTTVLKKRKKDKKKKKIEAVEEEEIVEEEQPKKKKKKVKTEQRHIECCCK
eukprot:TRINITY_DN297_c0_g1_i2.p2 TRINITY_DN297_c0_g1~~TRINITY_DN297_c0_g1_i2.p2  ORF type:complete len:301 (-),score=117.62 TRINITY_DN297_c0_g1_i2:356-1258(-)